MVLIRGACSEDVLAVAGLLFLFQQRLFRRFRWGNIVFDEPGIKEIRDEKIFWQSGATKALRAVRDGVVRFGSPLIIASKV